MALIVTLWLLLGPPDRGDEPVWVIRGGYESQAVCEAFREQNPNPHWLLCTPIGHAALPSSGAASLPYRDPSATGFRAFSPGAIDQIREHRTPTIPDR